MGVNRRCQRAAVDLETWRFGWLRPAVISKLHRDLAEHGGRDGRPLSVSTVSHIHRTLRKALADAVEVEQVLAVNPAARSKRPRISSVEPVQIWTVDQLDSFLTAAKSHRLFAFYRLAAYTGARRGELLYLRWHAVDLDGAEVTFGGSTAVVRGQRVEGTTKGAGPGPSASTKTPWPYCASTAVSRPKNDSPPDQPGKTTAAWSSLVGGENLSTPTP
jgi:integrase